MASVTTEGEPSAAALPGGTATRVDAAHCLLDSPPADEAAPVEQPAPAACFAEEGAGQDAASIAVQQMRSQAVQLATHLRRLQTGLDHREAELNARLASVETQVRSARLWLGERHEELAAGTADLDRRQRELDERESQLIAAVEASRTMHQEAQDELERREADVSASEEALTARIAALTAAEEAHQAATEEARLEIEGREAQLHTLQNTLDALSTSCNLCAAELDQRQAELDALAEQHAEQIAAGEHAAELAEVVQSLQNELAAANAELLVQQETRLRVIELERALEAEDTRRANLDAAEALLADQQSDLERQRELFAHERQTWQDELLAGQLKLQEDQQRATAEIQKKKQVLRRRSEDQEARRAALKQLRLEVGRMQRETLEMRLATEELWARLCGSMAPAALTQSLGQIRLKLADQNRLAQLEISEQKAELQALSARLTEQHDKFAAQKKELQAWLTRRQEEIDDQAASMAAREQELANQEERLKAADDAWHAERYGYQQEIRRLLRELRRPQFLSAAA